MVFVDCVGKLSDPVTQGDEFSIAQFFLKRLMIVAGDDGLVPCGKKCFCVRFTARKTALTTLSLWQYFIYTLGNRVSFNFKTHGSVAQSQTKKQGEPNKDEDCF